MSISIHHNPKARDALVDLILKNNRAYSESRDVIESDIDMLVEHAVADAIKYKGSGYSETIGARVVASAEDDHDFGHVYVFIAYYYNANTGIEEVDYCKYAPYSKEEVDPELIVGMIADEGF